MTKAEIERILAETGPHMDKIRGAVHAGVVAAVLELVDIGLNIGWAVAETEEDHQNIKIIKIISDALVAERQARGL